MTTSVSVPDSHLVLIKYGGSAITLKSVFEQLNSQALVECAQVISNAYERASETRYVIVHGAGSFGHFHARAYGLKDGGHKECNVPHEVAPLSSQELPPSQSYECWKRGVTLTRQSVQKLNRALVDSHVSIGLPAVSVSLFPQVTKSKLRAIVVMNYRLTES
jgi:isopentenyl phosphate kinase